MRVSAESTDVAVRPVRGPQVTLERVGAEAVLHDAAGGRAHVVNGTAARLWELCDGTRDLDELTAAFAAGYGMAPADVRADVEALLDTLRSLRLLA
jgi:PqqD family protein of HPr-rel-A system